MLSGRRRGELISVLIAAAIASGCGGSTLVIRLQQVSGDAPFAAVARLEAVVIADDQLLDAASVAVTAQNASGGELNLSPVQRRDVQVLVTGYDAQGDAVSAGDAVLFLPALDAACCMDICFCTVGLVDAGGCNCGAEGCLPCS